MVRFSLRNKEKKGKIKSSLLSTEQGLETTLIESTTKFIPRILPKKVSSPSESLVTAENTTLIVENEGREDIETVYENENASFEFSKEENGTLNTVITEGTFLPACMLAAAYFNLNANCSPHEDDFTLHTDEREEAADATPRTRGDEETVSLLTSDQQSGSLENDLEETIDEQGEPSPRTAYFLKLLSLSESRHSSSKRSGFDSWGHSPTTSMSQHSSDRIERVLSETGSFEAEEQDAGVGATKEAMKSVKADLDLTGCLLADETPVTGNVTVSTHTNYSRPEELGSASALSRKTNVATEATPTSPPATLATTSVSLAQIDEPVKRLDDNNVNTDAGSPLKVYDPRTPGITTPPWTANSKRRGFFGRFRGPLDGNSRKQRSTETLSGMNSSVWSKISGVSPPNSRRSNRMGSPTMSSSSRQTFQSNSSSQMVSPRSTSIQRIEPQVEPASEGETMEPSPEDVLDALEIPDLSGPTNSFMQFIASQSNIFGLTVLPNEHDEKVYSEKALVAGSSNTATAETQEETDVETQHELCSDDLKQTDECIDADDGKAKEAFLSDALLNATPTGKEDTQKKPTTSLEEDSSTTIFSFPIFGKDSVEIQARQVEKTEDAGSIFAATNPLNTRVAGQNAGNSKTVAGPNLAVCTPLHQNHGEEDTEDTVRPPSGKESEPTITQFSEPTSKKESEPAAKSFSKSTSGNDHEVDTKPISESHSVQKDKKETSAKLSIRNRFMSQNSQMKRNPSKVEWVYKSPAQPGSVNETAKDTSLHQSEPRIRSKLSETKPATTRGTVRLNTASTSKRLTSALSFESDASSLLYQGHHCWQPLSSSIPPRPMTTRNKNRVASSKGGGLASWDGHTNGDSSDRAIPLLLPRQERCNNYNSNVALARTDPTLSQIYNDDTLMATLTREEDTTLTSFTITPGDGGCCAYDYNEEKDDFDYLSARRFRGVRDSFSLDSESSCGENLAGKTLSVTKYGTLADDLTEITLLSKSTIARSDGSTLADGNAVHGQYMLPSQSTHSRRTSTVSSAPNRLEDTYVHMESIREEEPNKPRKSMDPLCQLLGSSYKKRGNGKYSKNRP